MKLKELEMLIQSSKELKIECRRDLVKTWYVDIITEKGSHRLTQSFYHNKGKDRLFKSSESIINKLYQSGFRGDITFKI